MNKDTILKVLVFFSTWGMVVGFLIYYNENWLKPWVIPKWIGLLFLGVSAVDIILIYILQKGKRFLKFIKNNSKKWFKNYTRAFMLVVPLAILTLILANLDSSATSFILFLFLAFCSFIYFTYIKEMFK